jgi:hypothetical protein
MKLIANRYLPYPRILHPWPEQRFLGACSQVGGESRGVMSEKSVISHCTYYPALSLSRARTWATRGLHFRR